LIAALERRQKPVINGEVCYEGIMGSSWQDTQRFLFWTHMLSGAAGHTYGNLSIAVFSSREEPYLGVTRCNDDTWEETYDLPGSRQVGIGKRLFERYDWQEFESHPEWIDPHWNEQDRILPYAAGIPGKMRIFYFPSQAFLNPRARSYAAVHLRDLEEGVAYNAHFFNPRTGVDLESFSVPAVGGAFQLPKASFGPPLPTQEDWVLVLDAEPPH
jgi:hypothetical protein